MKKTTETIKITLLMCCLGIFVPSMWGQNGVDTGVLCRLNPSRELPDQYWIDIVTEQPEGYVVDANGDVHLHSAEALAWLSVVSNGLNGLEADDFNGKKVTLEANVDMSAALWTPISTKTNMPAFSGTFDGKGHVIDRLQLKVSNAYSNRIGFFGNIADATLSNIVLRYGYLEGFGYGIGFFVSKATKSTIDHCFVECEMHGVEGAPFAYSIDGSDITNCMAYSPMLQKGENYDIGGAFAAENLIHNDDGTLPTIQNCAAIIEKMDCSFGETWGFIGHYNHGLIENCYVYIGELANFPGYSGIGGPRNGITKDNMGEIRNCYYNRIRNHDTIAFPTYYLGLDDQPAIGNDGIIQNTLPFAEDGRSHWKLTEAITFEFENGSVSTDDLLEALNLKVQHMDADNFLSWCDTNTVFNNHDLPVFCHLDISDVGETSDYGEQITLWPNPTTGIVRIEGKDVAEVQVFNTLGQQVKTFQNTNVISLHGLPQGIYLLRVALDDGTVLAGKVTKE